MIFQYELKDNSLRVMVPKELDHHSSIDLRSQTDMLLQTYHVKNLVFDFKDTEFMDSSGIGMMIGRCKNSLPLTSTQMNIIIIKIQIAPMKLDQDASLFIKASNFRINLHISFLSHRTAVSISSRRPAAGFFGRETEWDGTL